MSYLILQDYYSQIQLQNLDQLINGDLTRLTSAASKAEEQCKEHLIQKYELNDEFTDTTIWSPSRTYYAADRFYLEAIAYNPLFSYSASSLTLQGGFVYICTGTTTGAFDPTKWTLIGKQYEIFYASLPYDQFELTGRYNTGDQVFWKRKVYTALKPSADTNIDNIQYVYYSNIPYPNSFPDHLINGVNTQWGVGISYSVPAGTLPTDEAYFTKGDNRGQRILEILIDITLYKIHSRIAPRNIPELRVDNYHLAVQWLKDAAEGAVTPRLPKIQPKQGNRIRYGGNIKLDNTI